MALPNARPLRRSSAAFSAIGAVAVIGAFGAVAVVPGCGSQGPDSAGTGPAYAAGVMDGGGAGSEAGTGIDGMAPGVIGASDGATITPGADSSTTMTVTPPTVATIAGKNGAMPGFADGVGTGAQFNAPEGLALDPSGNNLYIADSFNHTIRHLDLTTMKVTTVAGVGTMSGFADTSTSGAFVPARLNTPRNLVFDPSGKSLFFTDTANYVIRKLDLGTFAVTTPFGRGGFPGTMDGNGNGARFGKSPNDPWAGGMVIDSTTDPTRPIMYLTDTANQTVRKIDLTTKDVTTIAGQADVPGFADAVGLGAKFNKPNGVALDGKGHLYVVESNNIDIRKIDLASGSVTTVAGRAPTNPTWVCENISPVQPPECDWKDAPLGTDARFRFPFGVALDGKGGMFVVDSHNDVIRHFDMTTTAVTTVAGVQHTILDDIPHGSTDSTPGTEGTFWHPSHAVFRAPNVLFVADRSANAIRRVDLGSAL